MEYLKISIENHVATITINHPPANALSSGFIRNCRQSWMKLRRTIDVRVILLHGEGRFFSAGADIKEFTK